MNHNFLGKCAKGIEADRVRIEQLMRNSLLLVAALTPYMGYKKAALILNERHKYYLLF
jgi:fumarate hydratase class II